MKSNELRLGNLVLRESMLKEIDADYFKYIEDEINNEITIPIPLTEEWLKRFGFKWVCEWYELSIEGGLISWSEENGIELSFGEYTEQSKKVPSLFIHQLQNLYFALTGEELILKDK